MLVRIEGRDVDGDDQIPSRAPHHAPPRGLHFINDGCDTETEDVFLGLVVNKNADGGVPPDSTFRSNTTLPSGPEVPKTRSSTAIPKTRRGNAEDSIRLAVRFRSHPQRLPIRWRPGMIVVSIYFEQHGQSPVRRCRRDGDLGEDVDTFMGHLGSAPFLFGTCLFTCRLASGGSVCSFCGSSSSPPFSMSFHRESSIQNRSLVEHLAHWSAARIPVRTDAADPSQFARESLGRHVDRLATIGAVAYPTSVADVSESLHRETSDRHQSASPPRASRSRRKSSGRLSLLGRLQVFMHAGARLCGSLVPPFARGTTWSI